ncbi:MAG: HAMP domain-containing protein [Chitinophagaceae bacterium]|nr:HAMP domain-containing protein [Chitinophagaceae bacterium]
MPLTVKQKIRWGTLFLYLLLMALGGVSIFHIVRLKNDSQIILKDNYESLDYCHAMQRALDSFYINPAKYSKQFDSALSLQEENITEKDEGGFTRNIRTAYKEFRSGKTSPDVLHRIQGNIQHVLELNMNAIEVKNNTANGTADRALTFITLIVAVIFLVGLTFAYNFPSVITNPINAITEGIGAISAKKYKHRIHLDRKDEFGQMAAAFNDMAERLEYFESSNLNKIIFEKTRAEAVINSLKDASIGIDKNGIILFANQQALQLVGMQSAQVVGLAAKEISKKNDLLSFLIEDKGNMPFKVVVDNKENYFTREQVDISEDGAKVIVIKNITSFKELDVAKTNFLATISHELKTPLASSDFSIKLLEDERTGTLSKEQKEYVTSLRQDNQRMLKILSELLNMAQIETGKMQLNIGAISPYSIADSALHSVSSAAKEKNIALNKQFDNGLANVRADADKTVWVINNFLTNAIKYSTAGSAVSVNLRNADKVVEFSVADEGAGIAPEHLPHIFDRFFKVPGTKAAGNGLGLAISKEFIEAQNGKIWVKSELGKGSVFGFSLPKILSTSGA